MSKQTHGENRTVIKIEGTYFKDDAGRMLMLRGVNLGGSSKIPFKPNGATWNRDGFYDHRNVSFVGRPFPLAQADEHFSRLKGWGFTFLRFLVTWESVEHAGPGLYDEEYLDYLRAVVKKAGEHGLSMFIDPHQDAWSRFTGGDGAPGWTLETAGFDLTRLHETGAAILHQEHGDPFPRMVWPTNNNKLAALTMFTLFFAGNDFAPQLKVDGMQIQEYLQSHYINAMKQVVLRLKDLPNVVGYDSLNEPSNGFIGVRDIHQRAQVVPMLNGDSPTMFQCMLMGSGYPQKVDVYSIGLSGIKKTVNRLANPKGERAWLAGCEDIWKRHGVWGLDSSEQPVVCKADYFSAVNGRRVDFYDDYFKPFVNRYAREIRTIAPESIIFVEGLATSDELSWESSDTPNVAYAPHWYDGFSLVLKLYYRWMTINAQTQKMILGAKRVSRYFSDQIGALVSHSIKRMNAPILIGEVGIPFDMQNKRAFRNGDFSMQIRALDATMKALEKNLASFTLWNYTADNSNTRGDQWNDEDFSLFSRDQMTGSGSVYDGGRALKAAVRPYPCKTAGQPMSMSFDIKTEVFEFTFRHTGEVDAPTEIFVPDVQYPRGFFVEVSDGTFEQDKINQTLYYRHTNAQKHHTIRIRPK
jgi:hypothetical protein